MGDDQNVKDVEVRLARIEENIKHIKDTLELMRIADEKADLQNRISLLEFKLKVIQWVCGTLGTAVISLVVDWLKRLLGGG